MLRSSLPSFLLWKAILTFIWVLNLFEKTSKNRNEMGSSIYDDGKRDPMSAHSLINVNSNIILRRINRFDGDKVRGFCQSIHGKPYWVIFLRVQRNPTMGIKWEDLLCLFSSPSANRPLEDHNTFLMHPDEWNIVTYELIQIPPLRPSTLCTHNWHRYLNTLSHLGIMLHWTF